MSVLELRLQMNDEKLFGSTEFICENQLKFFVNNPNFGMQSKTTVPSV